MADSCHRKRSVQWQIVVCHRKRSVQWQIVVCHRKRSVQWQIVVCHRKRSVQWQIVVCGKHLLSEQSGDTASTSRSERVKGNEVRSHINSKGRGDFSLGVSTGLDSIPQNSFGLERKPRSSLCTHTFHRTDSKEPDMHVLDG